MTNVDTRLNALVRIMTDEQKAKLADAAKEILMDDQKIYIYKGEIRYAETQHP